MLPLTRLASLWSCTLTAFSGVYVSWLQSFSQTSQSFSHTSQSYNEVGTTILFDFNDQVSLCLGEREHPLLLQACVHLASSFAPSCLLSPLILIKFYPSLEIKVLPSSRISLKDIPHCRLHKIVLGFPIKFKSCIVADTLMV